MTLFADLPGTFTLERLSSNDFYSSRGLDVVLVEQDLGFGRYAGWLPLPRHLLEEIGRERPELEHLVAIGLDHVFRPWRYPDEPGFLDLFDPTPRLSRWVERIQRIPVLARSSKRRWDVVDDAAFLLARRLRRYADRIDARFEARRSS